MNGVTLVIGGQYGSEGKGALVAYLTDPLYDRLGMSPVVVRTGGPNAGHSMLYDGEHMKMRQLPCSWHNPNATLCIGPGALIDMDVLKAEMMMVNKITGTRLTGRLLIDPNVALIDDSSRELEAKLIKEIGSTGKGIGGAQAQRVLRQGRTADQEEALGPYLANVPEFLHKAREANREILVESSQGFALSLTRGGFYPFATSRDLLPGAILTEAGVPHSWPLHVIMVMRTYPIRVAGNSGPLLGELTWKELSDKTGGYIKEETTTVTGLTRRVGIWDTRLAKDAVMHVQPDAIHLSFLDYLFPNLAMAPQINVDALATITNFEREMGVRIEYVGTGFGSIIDVRPLQRREIT